tara:strand:+ start:133 stop:717 length:585 start_codon:yes stop_codon:yes gene_type:complete
MIAIDIDAKQLKRLRESVGKAKKKFGRELAAAINATAKKTKLDMGRDVRSVIAIKKKESEAPLKIQAKATADQPKTTVSIAKTRRLGLRHFGARQDKKGVSFKISKQGGRQRVDGAFQGPKPGVMNTKWKGNAFRRVGKERLPIIHLRGVSAFGAYVKNKFTKPQIKRINDELRKQMERRINLNILRANGLVKT